MLPYTALVLLGHIDMARKLRVLLTTLWTAYNIDSSSAFSIINRVFFHGLLIYSVHVLRGTSFLRAQQETQQEILTARFDP